MNTVTFIGPGWGLDGEGLYLRPLDAPFEAPVTPPPSVECASAFGLPLYPTLLDLDRLGGFFGRVPLERLRAMGRTPAVSSSIAALISAALSGGISLTSAIHPSDDPNASEDPLASDAERALAMCRKSDAHLQFTTPPVDHLREMARGAFIEGHKLAEPVLEPDPTSPEGDYRLARVKAKPRWCYRFEVDRAMNVTAIPTFTADGKWERIDPGHYSVLTWDGRDGDPRGVDAIHPAHLAWNELIQAVPYLTKYLKQFGVPNRWGTPGPNAEMVPIRDRNGTPIPGQPPITPQMAMAIAMQRMEGGDNVAGTYGSEIKVVETQHDGSGLMNGIGLLEAWIVKTILHQVRATTEAKHGSKADSETGQDVMGNLVRSVRTWLCAYWRGVLRKLVAANLGPDLADVVTPEVSLGKIEPQDFAAYASSIAQLVAVNYFTDRQYPELDSSIGVTPRHPGDPRAMAPQPPTAPGTAITDQRTATPNPPPSKEAA